MRCQALTLGAAFLYDALGSAGESDRTRQPSGLATAPAGAHATANPYEGDGEAVRAGQKLFVRHCAECHGENAQGTAGAPRVSSQTVKRASPGDVFWFLTNGNRRAGMPSWSRLPETRRWQIVAFLKSLDATPTPP